MAKKKAPLTRAQRIEEAMSKAAAETMADGVTDAEEIVKRKLAARDAVKAKFAEEDAAAAEIANRGTPPKKRR
jgi:hypothetical protein